MRHKAICLIPIGFRPFPLKCCEAYYTEYCFSGLEPANVALIPSPRSLLEGLGSSFHCAEEVYDDRQ